MARAVRKEKAVRGKGESMVATPLGVTRRVECNVQGVDSPQKNGCRFTTSRPGRPCHGWGRGSNRAASGGDGSGQGVGGIQRERNKK